MNILFLCIDMEGLHGSFLHTLEYGEYFKSLGYNVILGSVYIAEENRAMAEERGFQVYRVDQIPNIEYDLVYALHLILFPALLLGGLRYKKAVSMTLSSFTPIEMIPPTKFLSAFDLIGAISQEAVDNISRKFNISPSIFTIIPNHIPLSFLNNAYMKSQWNKNIKNIAVISNHFVEELYNIKDNSLFNVDFIGSKYNNVKEVTPELLLQYDLIITIGKTVQYGLGLGIPVYQYDYFGGCGYITPDNVLLEEQFNFSGRKTKRKLPSANIIQELLDNYDKALENVAILRELAIKRYSIKKLIEEQLAAVKKHNLRRPKLSGDSLLFANAAWAALSYILGRSV